MSFEDTPTLGSGSLIFEQDAEGQIVTPLWHQKEIVLQIETKSFVENTDSLITKVSLLYDSWVTKFKEAKRPWLVGAIISREWEFWHKIEDQLELWPDKWSDLSDERKIIGFPWPNFQLDKLKEAGRNRKTELLKLMSTQNLMLSFLERPSGFPDYTGQFLHTSGEVSFEALLSNAKTY